MPSLFNPTLEQIAVVDAVRAGNELKIKAYASAGKTSTLRLIAQELSRRRGSYLAFIKEIADHSRLGFPANVSARTVHSLAYSSVPSRLTARVNPPAEPPHELAMRYGLSAVEAELITGKMAEITPFEVGRMIADGLSRFFIPIARNQRLRGSHRQQRDHDVGRIQRLMYRITELIFVVMRDVSSLSVKTGSIVNQRTAMSFTWARIACESGLYATSSVVTGWPVTSAETPTTRVTDGGGYRVHTAPAARAAQENAISIQRFDSSLSRVLISKNFLTIQRQMIDIGVDQDIGEQAHDA